ncbi:hypothetical protein ACJX0J_025094, partial [Zea mays]
NGAETIVRFYGSSSISHVPNGDLHPHHIISYWLHKLYRMKSIHVDLGICIKYFKDFKPIIMEKVWQLDTLVFLNALDK